MRCWFRWVKIEVIHGEWTISSIYHRFQWHIRSVHWPLHSTDLPIGTGEIPRVYHLYTTNKDNEYKYNLKYWEFCKNQGCFGPKPGITVTSNSTQKWWYVRYYRIDIEEHKKIPVPRSRNIDDVSGIFPLQQSLVIESYAKMLVREVLSDRYRIIQEQFQYQQLKILMTFRTFTLYQKWYFLNYIW